jgi:hypothetical protein
MATIHYLADRIERTANRPQTSSRSNLVGPAEIMLFTGVRYERWPETTAPTAETEIKLCMQSAAKGAQG